MLFKKYFHYTQEIFVTGNTHLFFTGAHLSGHLHYMTKKQDNNQRYFQLFFSVIILYYII